MKRRILLYNSLVKSILLYNSETWGLSQTEEEKLNAFHRKQLRVVLNIKHPHRISNKRVYERCSSKTIGSEIRKRQWELLGHIIRMDQNVPAHKAMIYYFTVSQGKKFRGRPRTTIITTINDDILKWRQRSPREARAVKLRRTMDDLIRMKKLALYRVGLLKICGAISVTADASTLI